MLKVEKDTIINGYPTKTIKKYYNINGPTYIERIEDFGVLQVRNDSVFYYYSNNRSSSGHFYLVLE